MVTFEPIIEPSFTLTLERENRCTRTVCLKVTPLLFAKSHTRLHFAPWLVFTFLTKIVFATVSASRFTVHSMYRYLADRPVRDMRGYLVVLSLREGSQNIPYSSTLVLRNHHKPDKQKAHFDKIVSTSDPYGALPLQHPKGRVMPTISKERSKTDRQRTRTILFCQRFISFDCT